MYREYERLETIERQLGELRQALVAQPAPGNGEGVSSDPNLVEQDGSTLLTLGDAMEHVSELEEQILFLQARVYELLESDGSPAVAPVEIQPRVLLPSGEVGQLIAQLGHEDPIERVSALYALALVEDEGIVRHITPLLQDADAYIRALAARILERAGARSAVQSLIDVLGDTDVGARESAVSALRAITGQDFRFDPRGPGSERFEAIKLWRRWWEENWRTFLYRQEQE